MTASSPCPTLATPRLTLSAHGTEDFEACLDLWSDPVVVRYFGGVPATGPDVWARLLRYAGLWSLMGFGYWKVVETETGRFVGEVGVAEFHRELTPSLIGYPEAGWVLTPWAHGRGFAREASEAMLAWSDRVLAARRTVCMIHPDNARSLALAARLGYQRFADTIHGGRPAVLLERFKPESLPCHGA